MSRSTAIVQGSVALSALADEHFVRPTEPVRIPARRGEFLRFSLLLLVGGMLLTSCEVRKRGGDTETSTEVHSVEPTDALEDEDLLAEPDPDDERSLEQRMRDAALAASVKLALVDEKALRRFDFEPEARGGIVVLHGDVPSLKEYTLAEQVARKVSGVREVRNAITAPGVDAADLETLDSVKTRSPAEAVPPVSPPATAQPASPEKESEASYHTVASGESLWEIAQKNGTTIEAIRRLNNLQGDRIRPGQRLRVR